MKKTLIYCLLAGSVLTACKKDEDKGNSGGGGNGSGSQTGLIASWNVTKYINSIVDFDEGNKEDTLYILDEQALTGSRFEFRSDRTFSLKMMTMEITEDGIERDTSLQEGTFTYDDKYVNLKYKDERGEDEVDIYHYSFPSAQTMRLQGEDKDETENALFKVEFALRKN